MAEMTGARESNAGDDFHFIWTARKALKLLVPNTDFEALCVEGPTNEESRIFENDEVVLLSIDVAEYFGGKDYDKANKVIFSQLKYSTRHGNEPWTLSNLLTYTNAKKDNSIIERLVQTYKGFKKKYTNGIDKLTLKLVSNREIEEKFKLLIGECKKLIRENDYLKYIDLKKNIDEVYRTDLRKFYDKTKLGTREFVEFIRCLDFSECGTEIRDIQEAEVINSMAQLGIIDLENSYNKLIQFIRKQMLPEENKAQPIDKLYMANFFNSTSRGLFPAPSYIEKVNKYVKRKDTIKNIVNQIIVKKEKYICLHATGGMGKTTVLCDLHNELPKGSVVLIYDCFGGGCYLSPETPLHTYKNAIIQLSNELALKCNTPFLIRSELDESEYLNNFSLRLKQASEVVKGFDDDAVILIALDAIDNSFKAAKEYNEKCFIENMLKMMLPDNVAILVTSRTENLSKFQLPPNTIDINLEGFNKEEEHEYVTQFYKDATDEQCEEVRKLTNGNPRVQYYIFSQISTNLEEALKYLNPNGKNLSNIFKEAMAKVDRRIPSESNSFDELCRALVELPRPIPIDVVIDTTDYDIKKLSSVCSEYLIGIYFTDKEITFRDEDFEYYLRSSVKDGESVINKIAEKLYNKRFDNEYAIRYLHIFLEKSNQLDKLLEAIYSIDTIKINMLEDEKNEILSKRIKSVFSIEEIYGEKYRVDIYKLLYIQAECNATKSGISEIVFKNIGLVKRLGFGSTIKRFLFAREGESSLNNLTRQTYANEILNNQDSADEFYFKSCQLMKEYLAKNKEERRYKHRIEQNNILEVAIYLAMKYDAQKSVDWLNCWIPYPVKEYHDLVSNLLLNKSYEKAYSILMISDNIDMFSACVSAYIDSNVNIKEDIFSLKKDCINIIDNKKDISQKDYIYRINLIELLLKKGKKEEAKKVTNETIKIIDFSKMSFGIQGNNLSVKNLLRVYSLNKYLNNDTYNFEELWNPSRYENLDKSDIKKRHDELEKIIDNIIESFFLRIQAIDKLSVNKTDISEFSKQYDLAKSFKWRFCRDYNWRVYCELIITNIFYVLLKEDEDEVNKYCLDIVNDNYSNDLYFNLIFKLIKIGLTDKAAELLHRLEKKMNNDPESAYVMTEFYLRCAKESILIDEDLSRHYFEKCITASKGVDEEAYRKIQLFSSISQNYIEDSNSEELAYNFTRIIEDSYRRLDDNKHLPQKDVFIMLSNINDSSAIASACRLEDRDEGYSTLGYEVSIPIIIKNLLKKDKISVEIAISIINMDVNFGEEYYEVIEVALSKIENMPIENQKNIIDVICSDIEKLSSGFENSRLVEMLSIWNKSKCDSKMQRINELSDKYEYIGEKVLKKNDFYYSSENKQILWNEVNKDEIQFNNDYLLKTINILEYDEKPKLVDYVLSKSKYAEKIDVVENLSEILFVEASSRNPRCLEVLIKHLSKMSSYNASVENWRRDENKLDWLLNIFLKNTESFQKENLDYIDRMFLIDKNIILNRIIKRASKYLKSDPWKVYLFIECVLVLEKGDNCKEYLEWCCLKELDKVHLHSSDEIYTENKKNNYTLIQSVAIYLVKLLGHIEKEKRWYAVHSIFNLYKVNEKDLIDYIFYYVFDDIPEVFKDRRYVYFKDEAITYFLIAIRRIVEDDKIFVKDYISDLKRIALDNNTINILHRELAKEILIQCIEPIDDKIKKSCDVINKKTLKVKRYDLHSRDDIDTKFRFDIMDIVPHEYYFGRQIFGKSEGEVMQECDNFISSWKFSYQDIRMWDKAFISEFYQRFTYGLNPKIQDLSNYLQYNAMYYVADKYRKTLPAKKKEDSYYSFESWIQSWLTKIKGRWVSDLKTVPPNIKCFLDNKKYVENDKYIINNEAFKELMNYEYNGKEYFILSAYDVFEYNHDNKTYHVDVGILKKKDIEKLMQDVKGRNYMIQYSFNSVDEVNNEECYIDSVIGNDYSSESEIEEFDPYCSKLKYCCLRPSEEMEDFFNTKNINFVDYNVVYNKSMPIKTQYWSYSSGDNMYNIISEGSMLFAEKEEFIRFLKSKPNYVVLLQIEISYSDHRKYEKRIAGERKRKIIILENNLESIIKVIDL